MVRQLSISRAVSQPELLTRKGVSFLFLLLMAVLTAPNAMSSEFEVQIQSLTAVDRQYMTEQRKTVEGLANRLGRRVSGIATRDLDTL